LKIEDLLMSLRSVLFVMERIPFIPLIPFIISFYQSFISLIHEAFASQALYCVNELGKELAKVNIHDGAIALCIR
jgi:hypothetical protein